VIEDIEEFEKEETRRLLNKYGISMNWLGYKYLVTAVPYVINKISVDEKIVLRRLYEFIAEKHKTTRTKVEYAIRYLHENSDIAKKMDCEKVSNESLIIKLAMILKSQYSL